MFSQYQELEHKDENIQNADSEAIIIVGLGPAGLAAAIEACRNNKKQRKIIALTDRLAYTRDTIFRLDQDIRPLISSFFV